MAQNRHAQAALLLILISLLGLRALPGPDANAAQSPEPAQEGTFAFRKIREDVYHAVGTGKMMVGSNAVVVINDADVLIVDSHVSPAAATALLRELRRVTSKPVRYVVNTHFHFDHAHGNQIYPPEVEIIGHEFTREMIASGRSMKGRGYERFVEALPGQIAALKKDLSAATDPQRRIELEGRLAVQEAYWAATREVRPIPPTTTLANRMTLFRGNREIRLHFFGRGHTGGDIVVHLPGDRVLITGDLLLASVPFMGDGYLLEWAETLEQLKPLAFDVMLPGHGEPFQDRAKIDHLQAYLRDLWEKSRALYAAGVPVGDAAQRVDMRNHAPNYPAIRQAGVSIDAMERIYELLRDNQRIQQGRQY